MNYKFKIGDRVICIKKNEWVPTGTTGTVDEMSFVPFVKWDNGKRYCISQDHMELIEEKKFKVGDIVRIVRKTGHAYANFPLGIKAKVIAEKESGSAWDYIVQLIGTETIIGWTHDDIYPNCQNVKAADLELVKEKFKLNIVIYRKDNKVIAQLHRGKNVYASAEAKCSPEDTFNFFIGSQIALQRLMVVCKDEMLSHVNLGMPEDYPVGKIITYEL